MTTQDVRHQVFVSSTFRDLVDERRAVMQALLELDCIPAGMELFPASDDDSWSLIRQVIDESDYYIVIVGGRYGTVHDDTGLSFTRMEYEYAAQSGKPVLGFLHEDPTQLPLARSESSEEAQRSLLDFRRIVERRQCRYWKAAEDLGGLVSRSIVRVRKSNPMPGWVRADSHGDLALRERILQLESELMDLRSKRTTMPVGLDARLVDGEKLVELELEAVSGPVAFRVTRNDLVLLFVDVALESTDRETLGIRLAERAIEKFGIKASHSRLDTRSVTAALVFMLAAGVVEQRGTDYRVTQYGIAVASELQRKLMEREATL